VGFILLLVLPRAGSGCYIADIKHANKVLFSYFEGVALGECVDHRVLFDWLTIGICARGANYGVPEWGDSVTVGFVVCGKHDYDCGDVLFNDASVEDNRFGDEVVDLDEFDLLDWVNSGDEFDGYLAAHFTTEDP